MEYGARAKKVDLSRCSNIEKISIRGDVSVIWPGSFADLKEIEIEVPLPAFDLSQWTKLEKISTIGIDNKQPLILPVNLEDFKVLGGNVGDVVFRGGSRLRLFHLGRYVLLRGHADLSMCDSLEELRIEATVEGKVTPPDNTADLECVVLNYNIDHVHAPPGSHLKSIIVMESSRIARNVDLSKCNELEFIIVRGKIVGTLALPANSVRINLGENAEIGSFEALGNLDFDSDKLEKWLLSGTVEGRVTLPNSLKSVKINARVGSLYTTHESSLEVFELGESARIGGGINLYGNKLKKCLLNGAVVGRVDVSGNSLEEITISSGSVGGLIIYGGSRLEKFSFASGAHIAGDLNLSECDHLEESSFDLQGTVGGKVTQPAHWS
ncbi:MAG: hypothetical protein LBG20_00955 [Holosporaceae bacterium]|nr:hypothetical protein [Holosporaceae bacterium]